MTIHEDMNAAVQKKEKELGRRLTPEEEHEVCYNVELDHELEVYGIPIRVSAAYANANRNHPYFNEYAECPVCGDFFAKRFLEPHQKQDHSDTATPPEKTTREDIKAKGIAIRMPDGTTYFDQFASTPGEAIANLRRRNDAEEKRRKISEDWRTWVANHSGDWFVWVIIALFVAAVLYSLLTGAPMGPQDY